MSTRLQLAIKRILDVVLCSIILVFGLPFFGLIAFAVKLSSPGPLFFIQERVGLNQKTFQLYKFRTMTQRKTEKQHLVWTKDDELRITKVGRFLRDYGLDEFPQLINIIKGDMSIIGPRPPLPAQVEQFTEHQLQIFRMRPGVLSLAAIRGRRSISPEQRIECHVEYVNKWSLRLDFAILWKSLFVVLENRNATDKLPPLEQQADQKNEE